MEKKTVKITELDVEPLADEDLTAIAGSVVISTCTCRVQESDTWTCPIEIE